LKTQCQEVTGEPDDDYSESAGTERSTRKECQTEVGGRRECLVDEAPDVSLTALEPGLADQRAASGSDANGVTMSSSTSASRGRAATATRGGPGPRNGSGGETWTEESGLPFNRLSMALGSCGFARHRSSTQSNVVSRLEVREPLLGAVVLSP
jgi:hypothetical protein